MNNYPKKMSLNTKQRLTEIAKIRCRENRKNPTEAERIFWEAVRRKAIGGLRFRRQHPIFFDITGSESFYIADFYCNQKKLIIEIDGSIHKKRTLEDNVRTDVLKSLGYNVIRFRNDEIRNNIEDVLERIKKILDE